MENLDNYTGRAEGARSKNKLLEFWRYAMVLVIGLFLISSFAQSQSITSFSQYANKNEAWINGILQSNNSRYYEGTATLQRIVFVGVPTSTNTHTLTFNVLAAKKGINAYDFVTGFEQAYRDYEKIVGSDAGLTNGRTRLDQVKGAAVPNPADATLIENLYTGGNNPTRVNKATAKVNTITSYRTQVQNVINFYDGLSYGGDRSIELYGDPTVNGPTKITNAQLRFLGYTNEDQFGDTYGRYELTWTSTSRNILILMAGHLAVGKFSKFPSLEYGENLGASSISGGPYHFKLLQLNGANNAYTLSLGNQDNQIQSGAILPPPECNLSPGANLCVGAYQMHEALNPPANASFIWTLSGQGQFVDASGNPLASTPTSSQVYVKGTAQGSYTLGLVVRVGGQDSPLCEDVVDVYANPDLDDHTADYCEDVFESKNLADFNSNIGASENDEVLWYSDAARTNAVTTTGTLAVGEHDFYVTVTNGNGCSSNAKLIITILAAPDLTAREADYCEDNFQSLTLANFNDDIGATTADNVVWKDSEGNTISETGVLSKGIYTFTATVTRSYNGTDSESCDSETTLTITILEAPDLTNHAADYCEDVFVPRALAGFNGDIGAEESDVVVWYSDAARTSAVTSTGALAVGSHDFYATVSRAYADTDSESCDSEAKLTITILSAPELANQEVDYCEDEMNGVLLSSFNESIGAEEGDVVIWYSDATRTTTIEGLESLMIGKHTFYATVTRAYAETNSESCDSEATLTVNVEACSRIQLTKRTDGQIDQTKDWSFSLSEVRENQADLLIATESTFGDSDGVLFDGEVLSRYKTYKICETNVASGFKVTIKYYDDENNLLAVTVFDPNVINGGGDFNQGEATGNYCFLFGANTTLPLPENVYGNNSLIYLRFEVNNISPPGGDARTPGYWKNWNTCSNGNQAKTAEKNGGSANGFWLLDDHLTHTMWSTNSASFVLKTCQQAVLILDERQDGGKYAKLANDAGYKLAKHLLAYQLNKKSGTYECASAAAAAIAAEALLAKINFNGTASSYLSNKGKANADYTAALGYAKILDAYNNNLSCASSISATSSTSLQGLDLAESHQLRAYPTPFTDKAVIEFTVARDENFSMRLYDMRGALVRELKSGEAKAGLVNTVEVDGKGLPEGLYIARMVSDSGTKTVKLLKKE